jgi:hypothetical protein
MADFFFGSNSQDLNPASDSGYIKYSLKKAKPFVAPSENYEKAGGETNFGTRQNNFGRKYRDEDVCCPQGTHFNSEYNCCVPDPLPPHMRCSCPPNMHYNAAICACVYDEVEADVCPPGMKSDGDGGCVRNPIPVCPKGFRYDETVDGCVKDIECVRHDGCEFDDSYIGSGPCSPCAPPFAPPPPPWHGDCNDRPPCAPSGICPPGYAYVPSLCVCVLEAFILGYGKKS